MDIKTLLNEMVRKDASDVYVTVGTPTMFRIEGDLAASEDHKDALSREQTQDLAFSMLDEEQRAAFAKEQEMNVALFYPELGRFRVNLFYQRNSIGLVIRHIKRKVEGFKELGLPRVLENISMSQRGLVLVVGAAGSGKSTTLASMLDYRSSNATGHIITIEDPIEFVYSHKRSIVTQREVGIDTHSYKEALKNALRQSPDVIFIGEIRDTETMEAALSFAETGHLCLSTLHANNASQGIDRILTFFPMTMHQQVRALLSMNLRAIISQRLVPRTDGATTTRTPAVEILLDTPRTRDLIRKGEEDLLKETMAKGAGEGMQTFDQSLFELFKARHISLETTLSYADNIGDLRLKIKTEGLVKESKETEGPSLKLRTT
ncbi:MAG: PilT/PilU family type 4a pilus ATPase [Planctomycetes bacterium]|nr:PilT/PilU family type 4a pilus ATPase [Planctomycetota bacterium]